MRIVGFFSIRVGESLEVFIVKIEIEVLRGIVSLGFVDGFRLF